MNFYNDGDLRKFQRIKDDILSKKKSDQGIKNNSKRSIQKLTLG